MLGHRHAGIAGIARQIWPPRIDDKAVGVRVRVPGRQTPIGKVSELGRRVWPSGGPHLKANAVASLSIAAPEDDIVIRKVMPRFCFSIGTALRPGQTKPATSNSSALYLVHLFHASAATPWASPLWKRWRRSVEQIVVCMKLPAGMRRGYSSPLPRAGQRSFEDVAEIKDIFPVRQHRMRDVLMRQPKARPIV